MKKCYQCGGSIKKVVGSITLDGISINDLVFEECQQCHEQYFDEKTSIFIQEVLKCVKTQKEKLLLDQST